MQDEDVRAEAVRWGQELLAAGPWGPERFRLELESERWRFVAGLGRERYQSRFRLWEACGWARVELDARGELRRVRLGAGEEPGGSGPVPGELVERAGEVACRAAREQGELRPVRVRAVRAESDDDAGRTLGVLLERHPGDGRLVVDLDPAAGGRAGFVCWPLFRGTTRSAALRRSSAVARARAAMALPPGARFTSARLIRGGRFGREWKLRFAVEAPDQGGALVVTLNARTGRVGALLSTVGPRAHLLPAGEAREAAERELRRVVARRLGPQARVGAPVLGAVEGGPGPRAAWLAAVRAPDGAVFRAVLDRGRVSLRRTA